MPRGVRGCCVVNVARCGECVLCGDRIQCLMWLRIDSDGELVLMMYGEVSRVCVVS